MSKSSDLLKQISEDAQIKALAKDLSKKYKKTKKVPRSEVEKSLNKMKKFTKDNLLMIDEILLDLGFEIDDKK